MAWKVEFLATAPPTDPTSGLSRGVWELASTLAARQHTVRVLYPSPGLEPPPAKTGAVPVPVPVLNVPRRPFGRDITIGRNASTLVDPSADLLVGNDEKAGALDARLTRPEGRPVFAMSVHDVALHTFDTLRPLEPNRGMRQRLGNFLDRRTLRSLEGRALSRARLILVGSELNRKLLGEYYEVHPRRVRLLPHGVPDPLDVGSRADARLALHVPQDVPLVTFVGRNAERQGLPIALEAFRRIRVFFPGARFAVVGSSPKTEPGVLSLGVVDEATKARVLRAADVFLFPARYEGFGLAPREAMRYGVPAVVSAHVPLEGIPAPQAIRVVSSDDPADYASELAELFADPALAHALGAAGKKAADEFSYARMADHFEEMFRPLLNGRP
ncbi:MAG TPA: glycosyltransferase family 4 protein [Thermoplasmata archaeon]|nr:glycosyltransferase family 4 protein [Thermoplasmata archaeon]